MFVIADTQPPRIDKCISPAPFTRRSEDAKITWDEPIFSDNSHAQVKVKQSHKPGIFPLGTTLVYYTASDRYDNNSTCIIEIIVQGDIYTRVCNNYCIEIFELKKY